MSENKISKKNQVFNRPDRGAAARALDEAEARKKAIDRVTENAPREINGKEGPDPARYGDWENKGIASDF